MTSRDFCYWLQAVFEVADLKSLDERQTDLIRRHLAMVFLHEIDPSFPAAQQPALDAAHSGTAVPIGLTAGRPVMSFDDIVAKLKELEERPPVVVQRSPRDTLIKC